MISQFIDLLIGESVRCFNEHINIIKKLIDGKFSKHIRGLTNVGLYADAFREYAKLAISHSQKEFSYEVVKTTTFYMKVSYDKKILAERTLKKNKELAATYGAKLYFHILQKLKEVEKELSKK